MLINLGSGRFHVKALPNLAQIAPGFGAALNDYDADGRVDLYIAQNFFAMRPSIGRLDGGLSQLFRGDGRGGFAPAPHAASGLIVPGDAKSLACVDFNGDGREDYVVGVNDDRVVAFENRVDPIGPTLRVRLEGRAGNPRGIGSAVRVILDDGANQTTEVHAGEGYLSQSPAEVAFGLGEGRRVRSIEVRWPTGETTVETPEPGALDIVIKQP